MLTPPTYRTGSFSLPVCAQLGDATKRIEQKRQVITKNTVDSNMGLTLLTTHKRDTPFKHA
jgi:hypothetical protein